jgi:flavin-dependent thymidylate synthase
MAKTDITRYADKAMFAAEPMERKEGEPVRPKVHLIEATVDPLGSIAAACKMYKGEVCRDKGDITEPERRHYWAQVQATHLKAPLEFVDMHFLIEGVTRAFTHQLVRQRTAVYAQESMRFAVKENMADEAALPPSIRTGTDEYETWTRAMDGIQAAYDYLVANGVPAEDARGLLPHATTTRVHYKTNLRNLLEHAGNRLCTQAQFEWRWVFGEIVKALKGRDEVYRVNDRNADTDRWQWNLITMPPTFAPVCYAQGKCPFHADFDRDCVIRERADAGQFNQINPAEWLLDPTAARRNREDT